MINYETAGVFLKAVGEETRLKIISYLAYDKFCVCDLVELLEMSQPLISQHLKRLKEAAIVLEEKRGKWAFHSLNTEHPLHSLLLQLVSNLPPVKQELDNLRKEGSNLCD